MERDIKAHRVDEDDPEGFRWINTSAVFEKLVYAAVTRLEDEVDYEKAAANLNLPKDFSKFLK